MTLAELAVSHICKSWEREICIVRNSVAGEGLKTAALQKLSVIFFPHRTANLSSWFYSPVQTWCASMHAFSPSIVCLFFFFLYQMTQNLRAGFHVRWREERIWLSTLLSICQHARHNSYFMKCSKCSQTCTTIFLGMLFLEPDHIKPIRLSNLAYRKKDKVNNQFNTRQGMIQT